MQVTLKLKCELINPPIIGPNKSPTDKNKLSIDAAISLIVF